MRTERPEELSIILEDEEKAILVKAKIILMQLNTLMVENKYETYRVGNVWYNRQEIVDSAKTLSKVEEIKKIG